MVTVTPILRVEKFADVQAYSNPVINYLNISGINKFYSIYLLNMYDRIAYSDENERLLDLSDLSKGIYFLKITVESEDY